MDAPQRASTEIPPKYRGYARAIYFTAIVSGNLNKAKVVLIMLTLNRWHPPGTKDHNIKMEIILDLHIHVGHNHHAHYFHPQYFSSQKDINQKQLKPHHAFSSLKDLEVFGCKKQSHTGTTVVLNVYPCIDVCVSNIHNYIIRNDQCLSGLCLY